MYVLDARAVDGLTKAVLKTTDVNWLRGLHLLSSLFYFFLVKLERKLLESCRIHADTDFNERVLSNYVLVLPNRHRCHLVSPRSPPPSPQCTLPMRLTQSLSQSHQRRVPRLR